MQILINTILAFSPGSWVSLPLSKWTKVAPGQLLTPSSGFTAPEKGALGVNMLGWPRAPLALPGTGGSAGLRDGSCLCPQPCAALGTVCVTPTCSPVCTSVCAQQPPPAACRVLKGRQGACGSAEPLSEAARFHLAARMLGREGAAMRLSFDYCRQHPQPWGPAWHIPHLL